MTHPPAGPQTPTPPPGPKDDAYSYGYVGADAEDEHSRGQQERFWSSLGRRVRHDPHYGRRGIGTRQ